MSRHLLFTVMSPAKLTSKNHSRLVPACERIHYLLVCLFGHHKVIGCATTQKRPKKERTSLIWSNSINDERSPYGGETWLQACIARFIITFYTFS
jgi:hypothetical protein